MSVQILKTISVLAVAAVVAGCGGSQGKLAVANPLEVLSGDVIDPHISLDSSRIKDGVLVLDGDNGEALNVATRLHRRLIELNIPNEIRYQLKTRPGPAQLQISFPTKLTNDQKRSLARALQTIENSA